MRECFTYITNPIWDAVFKYLMEDGALAKLLIGRIVQPEFRFQERTDTFDRAGEGMFIVRPVDFAARIRNAVGKKWQVLVGLQKAKDTASL